MDAMKGDRLMFKAACIGVVLFLFAGLANAQLHGRKCILRILVRKYELVHSRLGHIACQLERVGSFVRRKTSALGRARSRFRRTLRLAEFCRSYAGWRPKYERHRTFQEYLFGPRVSIPVGRFTPFAEGMVGFAHIHTGGTLPGPSNTSFATAVGGGLDFRVIGPLALRGEGDYIHTSFFDTSQHNFRMSFGAVLRF